MMKLKNNYILILFLFVASPAKSATWIHIVDDIWLYVDYYISEKHFLYEEDSLKNKMFHGPSMPTYESLGELVDVSIKLVPDSTSADSIFYTMYGKIETQEEWFLIANITQDGAEIVKAFEEYPILLAQRNRYEVIQNKEGDWELWNLRTKKKAVDLTPVGAANFINNPDERSLELITKEEWDSYNIKIQTE